MPAERPQHPAADDQGRHPQPAVPSRITQERPRAFEPRQAAGERRKDRGMERWRGGSEITAAEKERVLGEKARVERRGRIRQFVFGSMDGLLVPLGVVSGVAGGTGSTKAVVIAGLAEAFAGALSMGAGEFLSGRAEAQVQQAEIHAENLGIQRNPQFELEEMALLIEHEGVKKTDARLIAEKLQTSSRAFSRTM